MSTMNESVITTDKKTGEEKTGVFTRRPPSPNGREREPKLKVEAEPAGPPKSVLREYFESAVVTVIRALFGMIFIVQVVKVPTGPMQNTITIRDHLLVNKFIFAPGKSLPFLPQREIRRGDIIVFKYPGNRYDPSRDDRPDNKPITTNYVKRVIGLPGDRIRMEGRNMIINGKLLPEHQIEAIDNNDKAPLNLKNPSPRKPGEPYDVYYNPDFTEENYPIFRLEGDGKEIVIPAGKYFVMGDNRNNSEDSRYWGFVPRELVIGRAMFVYWSYDESAPSSGNFILDFFNNTRWSRTGTMVK